MNYDPCTPGELWNFGDQWQECVCGLTLAQSGGLIHEVSHLVLSPEARTSSLVEIQPPYVSLYRLATRDRGSRRETDVSRSMCYCCCIVTKSCPVPFVTPWSAVCQAPLSIGFSRQDYWSGLPFPSPGDLPNPVFQLASSASPALAGRFLITGKHSGVNSHPLLQGILLTQGQNPGLLYCRQILHHLSHQGSPLR